MIGLDVDVTGARRLLVGARRRAEGRELLQVLGDRMLSTEVEAFATSGFGSWVPLSPATVKAKGSARPLVDTGRLRSALTGREVLRFSDDSVSLYTGDRIAFFMRAGARGAPARNPLPPPDREERRKLAEIAAAFIAQEVGP